MRRWFLIATIMCLAATLTACPKPKSEAVSITPETATVEIGGTLALSAHVHPPSVSQRVVWVSETPSIASVSETGVVTGESIGTTSITASSVAKPTRSASVTIAVVARTQAEFLPLAPGHGLEHAPGISGELREMTLVDDEGEAHTLTVEIIDGLVVFGGDMILGTEDEIFGPTDTVGDAVGPQAFAMRESWVRTFWPHGLVRYTIEDDWDDPDTAADENAIMRDVIERALIQIMSVSGVRFIEYAEVAGGSYMRFRNHPDDGCSAFVGRRPGLASNVNLAFRCRGGPLFPAEWVAVHEVLHGLGFWHEHQRPDRDDWVDILRDNLRPRSWHNFRQVPGSAIGGYDLQSIMHYGPDAMCIQTPGTAPTDPCDPNHVPTMVSIMTPPAPLGPTGFLTAGDVAGLVDVYGPPMSISIASPLYGSVNVWELHGSLLLEAQVDWDRHVSVSWSSSLDGELGEGLSLAVAHRDLSVGTHAITATALELVGRLTVEAADTIVLHVTKPAPEVRLQAPLEPPCVGVPITLWASVTDPYYLPYPFPSERIDWWVGDPLQQPTGNPIEVQFESEGVVPVRVRATDEVGQYAEDAIELNVQHCVIARDDTVLVGWDWGRDVTIVIDVLENDESTSGRNLVIQEVREPVWQADIEDVYLDDVGRRGLVYSGPQSNAFEYAVSDGVDSAVATVRIEPDPSPLRIEPVLEWPGPAVSCDHVPDWAWPDACCVNDRGDVALSVFRGFEHWRAHIALHDGDLIDIGTLGGDESKAFGLNDRGWVVGVSGTADGADRAFLWTPEAGMHDLGAAGGRHSIAMAVSNDGHVVGAAEIDGRSHAVLWTRGGTLVNLGALFESGDSHATGVADSVRWGPVVVGTYFPPQVGKSDTLMPLPQPTAFRWHDANGDGRPQIEEFTELGHLGSYWSMATGINAALQVVGRSATPAGEDRGFTWADGDMVALEAPGGGSTAASGINRHGYVVGSFEREDGSTAGGIWEGGRLVESDDLLPAEWTLRRLRDVNDHGILIGEAVDVERCLQPVLFGPSSRF